MAGEFCQKRDEWARRCTLADGHSGHPCNFGAVGPPPHLREETRPEESPNHDRRGRTLPGNNLRAEAKKKKARGLARYLSQNTRDGYEMADIMMSLARSEGHRDQFRATEWVLNRIFGPAPTKLEVTGEGGKPLNPLAGVDINELLALAKAKTEGA